ncbi:50S ribosomal protein L19 [Candidatus Curtissbacteria bacterium]|nr:50S ribosomal protein L19 [Candidatus Curtissbacteria bacterium]
MANQAIFKVGDLIKVITRDPKENKVHATPFEGTVISFRGEGDNKTFVVRRVGTMKVAIERIFPLNSPAIEKIQVIKSNEVSRAKLYHLRKKASKK